MRERKVFGGGESKGLTFCFRCNQLYKLVKVMTEAQLNFHKNQ